MLAAEAERHVRVATAPAFGGDQQQLAHAFDVERVERVVGQHALREVVAHEAPGIVAAEAVGHLREVVGAEAQERRRARDLARAQRRARRLDHARRPHR
jgi:hypothetical protein